MKAWVTGGYFDVSGECFIDEIDLRRQERRRLVSFRPPDEFRVPGKGFTGGRWFDPHTLLVASFSVVWRFDVGTWAVTGLLHQPDFNDVHDVHIDHGAGHLFVCNTGLDAVEVFDLDARFIGRHSLSPAWFDARRQEGLAVERPQFPDVVAAGWTRADKPKIEVPVGAYYGESDDRQAFHRRVVRDYTHPNHVSVIDGRLAVTLLATKEVRCLQTLQTLASFEGHPHDGQLIDGLIWTTTTDGFVHACEPTVPWHLVERYDLSATGHVGWCRGVLVSGDGIAVALTRMHNRSQYRWRDDAIDCTETSVLWLERGTGRLLGRVQLDDARRPKLFAILPSSPDLGR